VSRKWERMVEKNRNSVNKVRRKQGKETIGSGTGGARASDPVSVIKGRSWMLPSFLVLFALFYFISFYNSIEHNFSFWFTGLSYIGLALLMYWIRRPVIKVSKDYITVRRFNGDKLLEPKDIKELTLHKDHVVIELVQKNKKLMYTRLQHRFPMEELNSKLRAYAVSHKLAVKE
jgi:hypothetical protein